MPKINVPSKGLTAVLAARMDGLNELDYYPTPLWATRALLEILRDANVPVHLRTVLDPACGEGHMVRALGEQFRRADGRDVHDYGKGYPVRDFIAPLKQGDLVYPWIITNPPFTKALDFVRIANQQALEGVCMFTRIQFLESKKRYRLLFNRHPPTIFVFSERVNIFKGQLGRKGARPMCHVWLIWSEYFKPGRIHWIPPSRDELERDGDYD